MTIGSKTGGTEEGVSYWGSHGETIGVGRSVIVKFEQVLYLQY